MKTDRFYKRLLVYLTVLILCCFSAITEAKEVVDQLGRRMKVPDHPQRIVSLAPSITEIIFALGAEDRLKGVTRFSNFPPKAQTLPKVGSYVQLDLEKIVALKPDLCIAVKDGNPRDVIDRLENLNIPSYAVDPRSLDSVMEAIQKIAELLNIPDKAAGLIHRMQYRMDQVKSRLSKISHRPGVFFQIGVSPIISAGTDTFIHELILLAGGKNLAQGPVPYPRFSIEQVLSLSPEILIITTMTRGETFERVKSEWSRWNQMPAVKNKRIHLVDSDIVDRASPRLIDALELLAGIIHPQFAKADP
ncbi:MAG: cobalamin-binding protein [Thermodesulfobacteriota bacterium]